MNDLKIYNIFKNENNNYKIEKIYNENIENLIFNINYNNENEIFLLKNDYIKIYYDKKNLNDYILIKDLKENEIKQIKETLYKYMNIKIENEKIEIKNYFYENIFNDIEYLIKEMKLKEIMKKEKNNLKDIEIYFLN